MRMARIGSGVKASAYGRVCISMAALDNAWHERREQRISSVTNRVMAAAATYGGSKARYGVA